MKRLKSVITLVLSSFLMLAAPGAQAWDGALSGPLANLDVAPANNFGVRVMLAGNPTMCIGGTTWAYLNEADSNYKVFVSALFLAKATGAVVTVYSTQVGGYCHIGYISIS